MIVSLFLWLWFLIRRRWIFRQRSSRLVVVCGVVVAALRLRWFVDYQSTVLPEELTHGIVTDRLASERYLVESGGVSFVLQTPASLVPGDSILVGGRATTPTIFAFQWSWSILPAFFGEEQSFPGWLRMKGYDAWIYARANQLQITGEQYALGRQQRRKQTIRSALADRFGESQSSALLLGMSIGDRSWFSQQEYEAFVQSGLVHLIAVSGSNIVYLTLFVGLILFRVPFYLRLVVVALTILVYGIVCGADSSVLRAVIMWLLGLLALWSGRSTSVLRLLSLTATSMLVRNPLLFRYDLWFLLSFGAVIGIWWSSRCRQPTFVLLRQYLLPSLGASFGVLPIIWLFSPTITLSSALINTVIVPLVPLYLFFAGGSFVPFLSSWTIPVIDRSTEKLFVLAERASQVGVFFTMEALRARRWAIVLVWWWWWWMYRERKQLENSSDIPTLPSFSIRA